MTNYIIQIEPKKNTEYNPIHGWANGNPGVILEAKVGERGWFAYKLEEDELRPWHRIHTSLVEDINESEDEIEVITENTTYRFVKVEG